VQPVTTEQIQTRTGDAVIAKGETRQA